MIICDTPELRAKGLMGVTSLGKNDGAIFIFDYPDILSFWGYETYIPLDIAFIREDMTISNIESIEPHDTSPVRSKDLCRYAIEMNRGFFEQNGYRAGESISFIKKANTDIVNEVVSKLPHDIRVVVQDFPVEFQTGSLRGLSTRDKIILWDDGSSIDTLKWILAHEYWHVFFKKTKAFNPNVGLGKELHDAIKKRVDSYTDERLREIMQIYFERHFDADMPIDLEGFMFVEMFADGLADLVIGKPMGGVIESYADAWISNYINKRFS